MNIILTLDYELYFGNQTGTVSKSIIDGTNKLLKVLDKYGIKAVFFVDIGFINRLSFFKESNPELKRDFELITRQLTKLSEGGHDLQLHIHPHWEDSFYDNGQWHVNAKRYKLSDWSQKDIEKIVSDYKKYLERFTGDNKVFAYRAGGWCIQPFNKIKNVLKKNDIWLDSTVFEGGYNQSETHFFDFRNVPSKSHWYFEDDPTNSDPKGSFLEIPISSSKVSPTFFWKLALTKIFNDSRHDSFGDGRPLPASRKWILKKLLLPSYSVASIDGYKASFLNNSFCSHKKSYPKSNFVIIGHPKALTNYSLEKLDSFIDIHASKHSFTIFSELLNEGIIKMPDGYNK